MEFLICDLSETSIWRKPPSFSVSLQDVHSKIPGRQRHRLGKGGIQSPVWTHYQGLGFQAMPSSNGRQDRVVADVFGVARAACTGEIIAPSR